MTEQREDLLDIHAHAYVYGEAFTKFPDDLYIPPDALEVMLQAFEGPLDLLLYLVRRKNVNILDVSVSEITDQYMVYVDVMRALRLELAAEYLVMAALLGEMKSRSLLPRAASVSEEEIDPKMQLLRRLQEYERFKVAAEDLDRLPRLERDCHLVGVYTEHIVRPVAHPEVSLQDLFSALREVLLRCDLYESHQIEKEKLSVRDKMAYILDRMVEGQWVAIEEIFIVEEGRSGVVVTFLALLELVKNALISCVQAGPFQPIYLTPSVAESLVWVQEAHEVFSQESLDDMDKN